MKIYLVFSTTLLLFVVICKSDRSSNPKCDFSETYKKHRIEGGWAGIIKSKCEALGNCYDDNTPNIKWCFLPTKRNTNNGFTTSLPIDTTSEAITEYFQMSESTSETVSETTIRTATWASPNLVPTEPILTITEYFQMSESTSETTVDTTTSESPNLITIEPLSVNESMSVKYFVLIIVVIISVLCTGLVLYFVYSCKTKDQPNQPPICSFKNSIDQ